MWDCILRTARELTVHHRLWTLQLPAACKSFGLTPGCEFCCLQTGRLLTVYPQHVSFEPYWQFVNFPIINRPYFEIDWQPVSFAVYNEEVRILVDRQEVCWQFIHRTWPNLFYFQGVRFRVYLQLVSSAIYLQPVGFWYHRQEVGFAVYYQEVSLAADCQEVSLLVYRQTVSLVSYRQEVSFTIHWQHVRFYILPKSLSLPVHEQPVILRFTNRKWAFWFIARVWAKRLS